MKLTKKKDNTENECARHFSSFLYDEDDYHYQRNKAIVEIDAKKKQAEPQEAWKATKMYTRDQVIDMFQDPKLSDHERFHIGRFKWLCCKKSFFEKGEVKCPHVEMDKQLLAVVDPGAGGFILREVLAKISGFEGLIVEIAVEDLSQMKITADGLVSSCDDKMNCVSGLAGVIKKAAGPEYEEDLVDHQSKLKNSGLVLGEVKTTKPGKLKCKHVIHTASPIWENYMDKTTKKVNEDEAAKDLQKAIKACLDEANKNGHSTLLLPLIGVGSGYELKLWWKIANEAFKDFTTGRKNTHCALKQVMVIDYSKATIDALKSIRDSQKP